ncbi:hypothetical protein GUITHDRAFT_155264 [Guillardia theta CCMP2712]|uniref:Uncharacterized protein n=1 Tax=Guillardia theta (strain CCMP2712) TaxID=905079 RepID=L1IJF2_GUITC|nr:hypothetical protein GUITHDRAFT_155264 [Guillardia theta CCMP2712]EKX36373.1 hypothetical protein GUITHDRAFT_155264 [Guillardia theta CCMP2712]|eukprot:XP_005823353.1 hypothetical protein GUITHDRAFT_155264 [Guillardia theta CCMP2712]
MPWPCRECMTSQTSIGCPCPWVRDTAEGAKRAPCSGYMLGSMSLDGEAVFLAEENLPNGKKIPYMKR